MQTSWNGDKTILQSINNTIASILQNTNVSMNSDKYNTTEIQNIKNSISGISTNVQATSGRDRYYYMLVKPTVAGGSLDFKDMPTIAKIMNDDENVEMGIFTCTYNVTSDGITNLKAIIDGTLEDDNSQIFHCINKTNGAYDSANVKNMLNIYFSSIKKTNHKYDIGNYYNDTTGEAYGAVEAHEHIIQWNDDYYKNYNFNIRSVNTDYFQGFCTSKYFKTLRLKALYYGSYMIIVKTKGSINYVDDITMNSVINTLDGTTNFQEDTTNSTNFKHYNYNNGNKSTNIYLQESAIVIPPTLI